MSIFIFAMRDAIIFILVPSDEFRHIYLDAFCLRILSDNFIDDILVTIPKIRLGNALKHLALLRYNFGRLFRKIKADLWIMIVSFEGLKRMRVSLMLVRF